MISRILNFIREKIREALSTVSSWFSHVYSYIHSYVGSAIESLKTWVINFVHSAIAGIRRVVQHVHYHITQVVKHVHHHITNITKHIHYHVTKVVEHVHYHVTKVVQHVHKHITNVTEHIYHHVTKVTKVIGLTIKEAEKLILKYIRPLKEFYDNFSRKITNFFKAPWDFLWEWLPFDRFTDSITKGLEDYTGPEEKLIRDYEELPTPHETIKSYIDEITGVRPEEGPAILPIIDQMSQAFERRAGQEMIAASQTWEKLRKEILERLALRK